MQAIFLVAVSVTFLALYLIYRRPGSSKPKVTKHSKTGLSKSTSPYHAIALRCGAGACDAAREIAGRRFLPANAPRLPVAGCSSQACHCTFKHFADRRDDDAERRALHGLKAELFTMEGNPERRMQRGRREADWGITV